MDCDLFYKSLSNLKLASDSIILTNEDSSFINIDFKLNINRLYFSWVHNNPINEIMIGKDELETKFNKNGWILTDYQRNNNYDKTFDMLKNSRNESRSKLLSSFLWDLYFDCFSIMVLTRT